LAAAVAELAAGEGPLRRVLETSEIAVQQAVGQFELDVAGSTKAPVFRQTDLLR
jgi:hypothetical protein